MNKMLEPWGFVEENNYESLQAQSPTGDGVQNEIDKNQWDAIDELKETLKKEIERSTNEDKKHDEYKSEIEANTEAIGKKADKEHTHEITDLRQGGSDDIVFDANATYDTTPKGE